MKRTLLALTVLAFVLKLYAGDTITSQPVKIGANEAGQYCEKVVTVTGIVANVTIRPTAVWLKIYNLPTQAPVTLEIFPYATNQFGDISALNGKSVEVTGKIACFRRWPEIILNRKDQLKVVTN